LRNGSSVLRIGAEITYASSTRFFDELDAPIMRVSQEDVPMPYNERLEQAVLQNTEKSSPP